MCVCVCVCVCVCMCRWSEFLLADLQRECISLYYFLVLSMCLMGIHALLITKAAALLLQMLNFSPLYSLKRETSIESHLFY